MYIGMQNSFISYCNRLINAWSEVAVTLGLKRRRQPVTSPIELRRFVEQRAKYIAQTTLYGYLKTRAGTRYTSLFEDKVFVQSINISKWEIYLACVSDLAVFSVAHLGRTANASPTDLTAIAIHLATGIFEEEDEITDQQRGSFAKAKEAFEIRARGTDWADVDESESAFTRSPAALLEWAPIAPQLKEFDTEIVINSMRFKWKHVRDELKSEMQGPEVLAAWRPQSSDAPGSDQLRD